MIKYCLFFLLIFTWSVSFYWHFLNALTPKLMIAYQGTGHMREFKMLFQANGADLWVFNPSMAKNRLGFSRSIVKVGQRPFKTFRQSMYRKMLLLNRPIPVPYHMDANSVIEYRIGNHTIASMWPRLENWPPARTPDVLTWYRNNGGHIVTVSI